MYGEIGQKIKTAPASPSLMSYMIPPYLTGVGAYYWLHSFVPSANVTTAKCVDTNGQVAALPWVVPNAITLTQIGIDVTSVTSVDAGGKLRFGIYADNGGYQPGQLIADLGVVAADATSTTNPSFVPAFSLPLAPGIYWPCMGVQGCATARPTTGSFTAASVPPNSFCTLSGSRGIPPINGSAVGRTWYAWTPSTTPAFTTTTTTFLVAPSWGGGLTTTSNSWPRLVIKIV